MTAVVSSRRRIVLLVLGLLTLQTAWVMTVPPFRASDEFDHAFRAASVAEGNWRATEPVADGRGLAVLVPPDLVRAARDQCEELGYTGSGNCRGVVQANGSVAVASGAATYNPAYYWVVGTVGEVASGTASLYAMRIASALICLSLMGTAGAILLWQRPGRWERLGLVVALTPVFVFSASVAAPNGPEMCAGLLLWASVLALGREGGPRHETWVLSGAAVAGSLLAFLRLLGPLWLVLILAVAVVFIGRRPVGALWRRRRRACLVLLSSWSLSMAYGAWWTWYADGTTSSDGPGGSVDGLPGILVGQSIAWLLQLTAAFPYRDLLAPLPVYVLVMLVVVTGLVAVARRGRTRQRLAVVSALVLTLTVPVVLSVATMESQGLIWQGRYGLPFVVGVLIMCGRALDDVAWAPSEGGRLTVLALVMVGAAWVLCTVGVLTDELGVDASANDPGWVHPPAAVTGLVTLLGWGCLSMAVAGRDRVAGSAGGSRVQQPVRSL